MNCLHQDNKFFTTVDVKPGIESHKVFPEHSKINCLVIYDHVVRYYPQTGLPKSVNFTFQHQQQIISIH